MPRSVRRLLSYVLLFCISIFLATCASAGSKSPATPPGATPLPASPTTEVTNPTANVTATPASEAESKAGDAEEKSFLDVVKNTLETIAGTIFFALLIYLAYRVIVEWRQFRFELADLKNGTGDKSLDDSLSGLQQIIREALIDHLNELKENTKKYSPRLAQGAKFPEKILLPDDEQTTEALDKVINALGDESPKYIKPLIALFRYLFPQNGIRVNTTLQHDGNAPGKIGVSFEIVDLKNSRKPILRTLWESEASEKEIMPWILNKTPETPAKAIEKNDGNANQGSASTTGEQEWSTLVAIALEQASLYQDAISYYQMSLLNDNTNQKASQGLVTCQNKLGQRRKFETAFSIASGLEKSSLLDVAIDSYAKVFPDNDDIEIARRQWRIALGQESGPKGDAYYQLAEAHLSKLDLYNEAIRLYKLALQEGSKPATQALRKHQTAQANELVSASQLLFENKQWKAASKYLAQALENAPQHAGAAELLAKVKQNQPVEEDKEALAAYELGKIYQDRDDFAAAKEHYKAALEKKPDYADAKEALIEVLNATASLRSRFADCFEKSLAWLAVEIFREETDKIKTSKATQDRRHAQYHNFYGAHFLSYCEGFPIYFQLAKEEFLEAAKLCPDWLQPYENLGDVYSIEAMDIKTPEAAFRHLERSISYYDIALKKKAMDISGKLSEDSTLNKQVEFRIKLDRNYADLLRWAEQVDELWKDIEAAEAEIRWKDHDQIVLLEAEHEEIYSSLASWYALVSYRFEKAKESCGAPEPDQAKPWASFFLTCAGLLNMDRMQAAFSDPLLMQIFPDKTKYKNLTTLIKTQHIQKDAYKLEEKFTWNDSVKALQKAGIELPKKLTKK